jgi:hypothetical protein
MAEAPGERLTPQHARAEWERLGITYIQWPPECDFVNRVLAAWQADREALERIRDSANAMLDGAHDVTAWRKFARKVLDALGGSSHVR